MEHHELALDAFVRGVSDDEDAVAVILVGSVARGTEREDSDVDVYLVVSDERFARETAQQNPARRHRPGFRYQ